jgi:lysophospholipase L1-like esterase
MPLGDSLTAGGYNINKEWHIDGGYREHLSQMLKDANADVDFVGRLSHGKFADAEHEGYSGWKIHQVDAVTEEALRLAQPDVVLLILGANDLFRDYEIKTAHLRMTELIKKIIRLVPNAKLFVGSTLTTSSRTFTRRVKKYNKKIALEVSELQKTTSNLYWVDMYRESNIKNSEEDLTDGVHPTYAGYKKMAAVWYRALNAAGVVSSVSMPSSDKHNPQ